MTKAKKNLYQIQYADNTYRMVDWTKKEFEEVGEAIVAEKSAIVLPEGIFRLYDVRTIVFIPEPEPTTEETEEQSNLSEYGHYDADTLKWLRENGVDLVKGGMAE